MGLRALVLRPGYAGFVATVSLSRITGAMFITAGVLLVLQRTGSAAVTGATAAASVIPGALTGPLLGALLDVVHRRRALIVLDQLTSVAALAAILALAGRAPDWTVPAVAVLYSATRPLSLGSFTSALAEIAGADLLDQASAIEATSLNLSVVVGPALAGVLARAIGAAAAVEVQIGLTVAVAAMIAANPVFEIRPAERTGNVRQAIREGTRALLGDRILRTTAASGTLASTSWGLMSVGFPLYGARTLGAGAHASGYLWAAVAMGSILGTFVLAGPASLRRMSISYAALGASALLWPLARSLGVGLGLITLTGFLEGPAYSSSISLRQRRAPAAVRAQVMTTVTSVAQVAFAVGAATSGIVNGPVPLILLFVAVNLAAAAVAAIGGPGAAGEGGAK